MALFNSKGKPGAVFNFSEAETVVFLCTVLFLLVLAAFSPALNNEFINFDDPVYVTANAHVQAGLTWPGVAWAFRSYQETANWHPLTWLSHMLDCQFFGLNPLGHHLISVLLHAVNTVALFLVFRRLTQATWRSFFVAALFGLHPLHVESVAWVAERKDVLSTLFLLLALWAYARFAEDPVWRNARSRRFYALALGFFLLGLMAKPMLVTLPFVLLLLDYWPLHRMRKAESGVRNFTRLLVEKIPFFLFAAAASIVTFAVQKTTGAVASTVALPFLARMENAIVSYCLYLWKLLWPENLAIFYPHPMRWPGTTVLLALFVLSAVSILVFAARRGSPFLWFGWLWFAGTLVPVSGLVQVGSQAMADRYSYVPAVGIFIAVVWGVYEAGRRWRWPRTVPFSAGAVVLAVCLLLTRRQVGYWQNSGTVFGHAAAITRNNYVAYMHVGNFAATHNHLKEAAAAFERAAQIYPAFADAHYNLGIVLRFQDRPEEAIQELEKAVKLDPVNAAAHDQLGQSWLAKKRFTEAIRQFQATLDLNPTNFEARNNLGFALANAGRLDEAAKQLEETVRSNPAFAKAQVNLGIVLAEQGKTNEAVAHLREAIGITPDDLQAKTELLKLESATNRPAAANH